MNPTVVLTNGEDRFLGWHDAAKTLFLVRVRLLSKNGVFSDTPFKHEPRANQTRAKQWYVFYRPESNKWEPSPDFGAFSTSFANAITVNIKMTDIE